MSEVKSADLEFQSSAISVNPNFQMGMIKVLQGETDKARVILKDMETTEEFVSPAELAILYAALGDKEKAFRTLERACADRDFQLIFLNVDAGYDSLRDDPRFKDLVRLVGLPEVKF